MRRTIFLIALILTFSKIALANTYKNDVTIIDGFAAKTQDIQDEMQILIDYVARTDGQPVYLGSAVASKATSDDAWIIYTFTYDGNNQMTSRKRAYGTWDNRAALTYE